jgi:small GTP-binding protein
MISKKVILTGSFGVGKTSLFRRFLTGQFNDKYLTTVGAKIGKKEVQVEEQKIALLIWDIAGEITQDKVPASYFLGASGVIYVMDMNRPSTFAHLEDDINFLKNILPYGVFKIVANKRDLVSDERAKELLDTLPLPCDFVTSAKTGDNVEILFQEMAANLLENHHHG